MLDELYMDVILEHSRSPRNFGKLDGYTHEAEGYNPLCGDKVHIFVKLEGDKIESVRFEGVGCAICTASASMMTQAVQGRQRSEAEELSGRFREMVTTGEEDSYEGLGELVSLGGVRKYPIRIKCATLSWHALLGALNKVARPITTEE